MHNHYNTEHCKMMNKISLASNVPKITFSIITVWIVSLPKNKNKSVSAISVNYFHAIYVSDKPDKPKNVKAWATLKTVSGVFLDFGNRKEELIMFALCQWFLQLISLSFSSIMLVVETNLHQIFDTLIVSSFSNVNHRCRQKSIHCIVRAALKLCGFPYDLLEHHRSYLHPHQNPWETC